MKGIEKRTKNYYKINKTEKIFSLLVESQKNNFPFNYSEGHFSFLAVQHSSDAHCLVTNIKPPTLLKNLPFKIDNSKEQKVI